MSSNSRKLNQIQGGEKKVMKKSLSLILSFAMVISMFASVAFADTSTTATDTTTTTATDTPAALTPQQQFDALKAKGIFDGDPVLGANLDANMTRAQFAKIISKLWNLGEDAAASSVYSDISVDGNIWAAGYIGAATKAGILNGEGGGIFNPSGNVTLQEIAKVLAVGLNWDTTSTDVGTTKVDDWAKAYVAAAIQKGYIMDGADTTNPATRSFLVQTTYTTVQAMAQPTASPVPSMSPLAITSAVSLNSKVVQVTLSAAAAAADADVANVAVKDSAGADIAVSSVALAPYDTSGKKVLVTLGADTAIGSYYTITSGTTSVNFGGGAVDTTAPKVSSVVDTDYNQVTINFDSVVDISKLAVTSALAYDTKAALNVSNIAYSGSAGTAVLVTTDAQTNNLYTLAISGAADLAGNAMTADNAQTFVGKAKPTTVPAISSVTPVDSKTVKVTFNVKMDTTTALDATKYSVKLAYTPGTADAVTAVATDADDTTGQTVVLTLADDTVQSLYSVSVAAGVTSNYGVASTAASTSSFVGIIADTAVLPTPVADSTNNTTVTLTFGNSDDAAAVVANTVDAATTADQITINEAYNDQTALAITGISIKKNVITLTTAAQSNALYNVVVKTGIKDAKGNATTADLKTTFVGKTVATAIASASATLDGTTLKVVFDKGVNATEAVDVAHYSIDNSIGYPLAASLDSTDTSNKTVKLTLPATSNLTTYTLTVTGLHNSDGVAMAAAGVTAKFIGSTAGTLPTIQAVIATDQRTLNIYFDRDVTNATVKGPIWSGTALNTGVITLEAKDGGVYDNTDLGNVATYHSYAYQDATNKNILVVRVNADIFKSDNVRATVNSFALLPVGTGIFKSVAEVPFVASSTAGASVTVSSIYALDSNTIRIYFNQPVVITPTAGVDTFAQVALNSGDGYGHAGNLTLSNASLVAGTNNVAYDFKVSTAFLDSNKKWLVVKPTVAPGEISDLSTNLTMKDEDSATSDTQQVREFAGSTTAPGVISNVSIQMTDAKTLVIYYPEAMVSTGGTSADVTNKANYTLTNDSAGNTEVTGTGWAHLADHIVDQAYDAATNKVTFTLDAALPASTNYYLKFGNGITLAAGLTNAVGTKPVAASTSAPLVKQFANSSVAAAKVTVSSAVYTAGVNPTIKITLNQKASSTSAYTTDAVNDFLKDFTVSVIDTSGNANSLDNTEITAVASTIGTDKIVTITLASSVTIQANSVGTVGFNSTNTLTGLNGEKYDSASKAVFSARN